MAQKDPGDTKKTESLESVLSDPAEAKKADVESTEEKGRKASAGKCEILGLELCMILDPLILYGELQTHYLRGSSDLAYAVFIFLLVMPLIFVQLFIGQYTQLCCLYLGRMLPLLHGVGIVLMIMNLYTIVLILENSDVCLHYLFLSVNEPWKNCEFTSEECVPFTKVLSCTGDDCPQAPYEKLSGYLYFREKRRVRSPELIVYMILLCAMSCGVAMLGYRRYRRIIKVTLYSISFITVVLIFTVITLTNDPTASNEGVRKASLSVARTTFEGLAESITRGMINMEVGSAAYFMYGTYLPPTHKANITSFAICVMYIVFIAIGAAFLRLCYYSMQSSALWPEEWQITPLETLYVIVPQYLGSLHVAPFFLMSFYWCCFILILTKLVLHTEIISDTIILFFPKTKDHRIYIVVCVSILSIACTIPHMMIKHGIVPDIILSVKQYSTLILLEIEMGAIMYIYSYAIFSDDIHFAYGSQPATLWKVLWVITPLILFISLVVYDNEKRASLVFILLVLATMVAVVVGALYKLVKTIKAQNALNFLMPEEKWGMEDPFMCKLRKIYNPRDEIRSQRKVDECVHECLIGSEVLSSMIKTEIDINLTVKMEKRVPRTDEEPTDVEGLHPSVLSETVEAAESPSRGGSGASNTKEDVDKFYEELLQKYGIELE